MAGENDREYDRNNERGGSGGGGGGSNQGNRGGGNQAKKPVTTRMQFANWISLSQIAVFAFNVLLNWVVLWYYTAPRPVVEAVDAASNTSSVAATPGNSVWYQWWWLINIGLATLAQIVLVYVPMFIDPAHRIYGSWRDNLQRIDTFLNYVAFTILATQIMGVAPGLSKFLGDLGSLLDQLIQAFGGILDLEVIVTLAVIYLLAAGVRHLGLITTLLPRTHKKG